MDPETIGATYDTTVGITGDAKAVLAQLLSVITRKGPNSLSQNFTDSLPSLKAEHNLFWRSNMPNQAKTMDAIRDTVNRDAIFIGDVNMATHHAVSYTHLTLTTILLV